MSDWRKLWDGSSCNEFKKQNKVQYTLNIQFSEQQCSVPSGVQIPKNSKVDTE